MQQIHAKVTEQTLEKIKESGKSVYQFVQDAVADAINSMEKKEELLALEQSVKKLIQSEINRIEERNEIAVKKMSAIIQTLDAKITQQYQSIEEKNKGQYREIVRMLEIVGKTAEEILRTR